MASGAQLNRWGNGGGVVLLPLIIASTTVVNTPTSNYGTVGQNDSGAFVSPIGFSKFGFQMLGGGTGYSVTIYGTYDPAAYRQYTLNGGQDGFTTGIPASSWFQLPGPADQSGTGSDGNPLTSQFTVLYVSRPLVAIRAVLTGSQAPSGQVSIVGFGVP